MATLDDFEIPNDFANKGGFATEQTLQELRDAVKATKRQQDTNTGTLGKQSKQAGQDIKVMGTTIGKMNPALAALETGFNMLGSAITGATGLVKSIASADGSFESLGSVVDFAAEQITNTFGRLPIIGGFISASAAATAEVTKLRLVFMDLQKETFQGLSASGFRLTTNLNDLIQTVLLSNISVDQFNRIVTQNADGLRVFGGTFGTATEKFAGELEKLTGDQSPVGMGLRLLGLGSNEIAEEFADFIQTNRNNSRLLSMDNKELNKQLQDRIKSERVIAEITGISAQEQRQQQMQLAGEAAFQAALLAFPPEQRDVLTTFVSGLTGPAQDAAKQLLAFGTITDEQTALLSSAAPGLIEAIQGELDAIRGGSRDADASVARILKVGAASADQLAELAKLGILDPAFNSALGEFFLQIQRSQAQLEIFNLAQEKLNKPIKDQESLVAAVNDQYATQFEIAEALADKGSLTVDNLIKAAEEQGMSIDSETARIIKQAADVEEAVGTIQKTIFDTLTNNFEGLTDVVVQVIDVFDDLLSEAGVNRRDIAASTGGYTKTGTFGQVRLQGKKDLYTQNGEGLFYFNSVSGEMHKFTGSELQNQFGGPIGPNTLSMVGEAGRELINSGNTGGEVINNATTEKIMGAANAVVNNIGNDGNDILKQISDILNQSNTIQSNILKETRRSKGFQY